MVKLGGTLVLAAMLTFSARADRAEERIYGLVTTVRGDVYEGFIRWDRNETGWSDVLDAQKEIPWENFAEAEELDPVYSDRRRRERSIEAFGVRITWDIDDGADVVRVDAGVRFGQIESLVVLDDRRARIWLRDGESVELRGVSSDLGRRMRSLIIEDREEGEVELEWRDLDRIDFEAAPASAGPPVEERLFGTLTTRDGDELTGYVAWDRDEVFHSDILDGNEVETRREQEIPFGGIAAIERDSRRTARVILRSGEEIVLRGTNDVNQENRGIEISDPALGRATVGWADFDVLTFHDPEVASVDRDGYGGTGTLYGTVENAAGVRTTGEIRWDNDEEFGWEFLSGWAGGVDYDIEFSRIASIEGLGRDGASVTLLDGRTFELTGTNDVDDGNKGIFVTPRGGRTVLVRWDEFVHVGFVW